MNCRFCGYYYSRHESGNTCQHCGGNREGMSVTKLTKLSKILILVALLAPVAVYLIYWNDLTFIEQMTGGERPEGDDGGVDANQIFFFGTLLSYIPGIMAFFRRKKCAGLFCLTASALIAIPAFVPGEWEGVAGAFLYALPFVTYVAAAVISFIDRHKQLSDYRAENPIKKSRSV